MKKSFTSFKELGKDDFKVLHSIETGLKRSSLVPQTRLLKYTKMDLPDLKYHLGRLGDRGLIHKESDPYEGFQLLPLGYDFLALNVLVNSEEIEEIGGQVAVGKESEIYEALNQGRELIVKFHRLGRTSFHEVNRLRPYLKDKHHFTWLYAAKIAAKREYRALNRLNGQIPVPEALSHNRNAVIESRFHGNELSKTKAADPGDLLEGILESIARCRELGIIHGDLSEYNVLINGKEFRIIDWPQWIGLEHPQAGEIFERDVQNICNHFRKKYPSLSEEEIRRVMRNKIWEKRKTS